MEPLERLLARWRAEPALGGNVTHWHKLPARPAQFTPLPNELHPALAAAMARLGFGQLYSHQAAAWEQLRAGQHVAVVTGTASGKTLCYNLPVLDKLLRDPEARALYLFPTKALAYDQKHELDSWLQAAGQQAALGVATYDGDTPNHQRSAIRRKARLLISNPD
ncbi:MAG: DEAD/DEAH box helicase, partial [Anaerolineales bacterium]|nr:DEAD/DEAH box helicase [Anaerolineales bacterium]